MPSVEKVLQRDSAQNGLDASANIAAAGAPSAARSSGLSRRVSGPCNGNPPAQETDPRLIGICRTRPVQVAPLPTA